jgi:hypothetical protein
MHAHLIWQPLLVLTLPPVCVSFVRTLPGSKSPLGAGLLPPAGSPPSPIAARTNPPTPPSSQISAIAVAFPLLSYIAFQDDYRGMKPWTPGGLLAVARKTYAAVDARGRVGQKDL